MILGTNLKTLREKEKKTVEEVSNELSIDVRTLVSWEMNKTVPDMDQLLNLADYYHINTDDLLLKEIKEDNEITIEIERKNQSEINTITVKITNHKI